LVSTVSNKAIFLDRDGTINWKAPATEERVEYIKSWDDFKFIPGAEDAIKLMRDSGFKIIVITNQSQISRGIATQDAVDNIHANMKKALEERGVVIDAIYLCTHHPDENCNCRKPKPGMVEQAAKDLDIDLLQSYVVGDAAKDIMMGNAVGCKTVFVKTGEMETGETIVLENGELENKKNNIKVKPDKIVETIVEAAEWIASQ
jgi:D-glycero-D-manno-heptose 1,7-bisphosphate phosphatase